MLRFRETVRIAPWIQVPFALVCLGIGIAVSVADGGSEELPWLLAVLIGFPLLFAAAHLRIEVDDRELRVGFPPLPFRRVLLEEIHGVEAVTYSPIFEYGGWGLRWSFAGGMAYTMRGSRGVRILQRASDGRERRLLVGSMRPGELVEAIHAAQAERRP